jgi:hypothetical protein
MPMLSVTVDKCSFISLGAGIAHCRTANSSGQRSKQGTPLLSSSRNEVRSLLTHLGERRAETTWLCLLPFGAHRSNLPFPRNPSSDQEVMMMASQEMASDNRNKSTLSGRPWYLSTWRSRAQPLPTSLHYSLPLFLFFFFFFFPTCG